MSTSSANSSFIIFVLFFRSIVNAQWSNYNQILDSNDGTASVQFKGIVRTGGSTYIYQQGTELVVYKWNTGLSQMDFVQRIKPSDLPSSTSFSTADVFNKTIIIADSTNAGVIYVFRQPEVSHSLEPFVLVQTITGQLTNGQMGSRIFLDHNQLLVRSRNTSLNLNNILSVYKRTSSTANFGTTPEKVDTTILKKSAHFIHLFRNTVAVSEYESNRVHIFDRGSSGFTHFQEILPPSNFNGGLGYCTTFFHNTLIACNNGANICGTWKRDKFGSRFFQTQTLKAVPVPAPGGRLFGIECQMEGNLAVIGQRGTNQRGYAFLFLRNDSSKPYEFRQYIQGLWQRHFATRIDVGYPFVTVGHDLNNGRVFLYQTTAPESLINPAIAFPTTTIAPNGQLDVGTTFSGVKGLPPSWTSGGDPCGFAGVTCGADGKIQAISLAGANLTGEMNLAALPKVANMDLSGNPGLNGTLNVKSFPTVLIIINIINTGISGTINPKDLRANVTLIASTSLFCLCPDGTLAGPRTNSTCTGPIECAATCPCPRTDARTQALNQVSQLSFILLASAACFYVLIGFIGYCVAKKNEQQNYRFWVFLGGTLSSMDMYSDVAFVFTLLALNQQILAFASIVFIVLPVIANIIGTVMLISNWKSTSVLQAHVHRWTERFGFFLATFFVLTGSTYGAISLSNCYLFGWPAYSMGIPRRFRESVAFSHLVTTVILENVPQVLIQLVLLLTTPSQFTLTPLFAMVTSIAVILRTTIKFLIQYANRTSGNEFEDWIQYEIQSDELRKRYEEVRVKTHKFRTATAIALEKDVADTDMLPIVRIRDDAIQVTVSIRTLASEDITPGFDSFILSDSSLANAIQKKFKLNETPRIVRLEHLGRLNQADGFACGVCKRSDAHRMTAVALASTTLDNEQVATPRSTSEVDQGSGTAGSTRSGRVWTASEVDSAAAKYNEGYEGQEGDGGATEPNYPGNENGADHAAKHVSTNDLP